MFIIRAFFGFIGRNKLLSFALFGLAVAGILTFLYRNMFASLVLTATAGIGVITLVVRTFEEVRDAQYGAPILPAVAIGTAAVLQQGWVAGALLAVVAGQALLERVANTRLEHDMHRLEQSVPELTLIVHKHKVADIAVSDLRPGDQIMLRAGDIVPVDAVIIDGTSSFDESPLFPALSQTWGPGATILGGSVNVTNEIKAEVIHTLATSQHMQRRVWLHAAADHPASFVLLADRYSILFVLISLTIGGVAWILTRQPIRFLDVLVVATPIALVSAVPLACLAATARALQEGVRIKTGLALEQLSELRSVVFSQISLLSPGEPKISSIKAFAPFKKQDVVTYAVALTQTADPSVAAAITHASELQDLKLPKTKHVHETTGRGFEAHMQGKDILFGTSDFIAGRGVDLSGHTIAAEGIEVSYLVVAGTVAGSITFDEQLREDAKATTKRLRRLGVTKLGLLAADSGLASSISKQLGLNEVIREDELGDQVRAIERLDKRPTAFVGTNADEAPVYMAADVGIGLGVRGTSRIVSVASVLTNRDDLRDVALAATLATRAFRIVGIVLAVGLGASFVLMIAFGFGLFPPLLGVGLQAVLYVVSLGIALQAYRPVPR